MARDRGAQSGEHEDEGAEGVHEEGVGEMLLNGESEIKDGQRKMRVIEKLERQ